MEPSDSPTKMGSLNVEDITATDTSPIAQSQISPPHTASPPVSCPGSPTTNAKRYSPGPVPEARNAGPAVWHGIKGSNMKRHMHVNFLIDVPPAPAPASPLGLGISSGIPNGMVLGPPPGGDIIRPHMSPSTSPSPSFLLSRSPPRSDTVNSGQISGQRADDILSAIHALQLPERYEILILFYVIFPLCLKCLYRLNEVHNCFYIALNFFISFILPVFLLYCLSLFLSYILFSFILSLTLPFFLSFSLSSCHLLVYPHIFRVYLFILQLYIFSLSIICNKRMHALSIF